MAVNPVSGIITALFLAAACFVPSTGAAADRVSKEAALGLPESDGPLAVHASFHLLNISGINDEAETVELSGVLRLVWRDSRQAFDTAEEVISEKIYSGGYQFDEISPAWYPQVTLVNAVGQQNTQAVLLRVRPDGTCTLTEALNAVVKVNINMRQYPFDRQKLDARFDVLGFDADEVALDTTPLSTSAPVSLITVPHWSLGDVAGSIRKFDVAFAGGTLARASYVVTIDVKRKSFFMIRLVVLPLFLIVMLSWAVFWMDRSSLGDRMSVSFVGILTAVAFQTMVGGLMAPIDYLTLMNAFIALSFLVMCATVVINLVMGALDRSGNSQRGDRIDRRCRWIFPSVYAGLLLAAAIAVFNWY